MELISDELKKLKISKHNPESFIQKFSELTLDKMDLDEQNNILFGVIIFGTKKIKINNFNKKYYMIVTNYYTEHKFKNIYPLSIDLNLINKNKLNNKDSYIKDYLIKKFKYTLDYTEFEILNNKNVVILGININKNLPETKKIKKTRIIHFYKNPEIIDNNIDLYKQVIQTDFNKLKKKFYFFYKKIKVCLREENIIKSYVNLSVKS